MRSVSRGMPGLGSRLSTYWPTKWSNKGGVVITPLPSKLRSFVLLPRQKREALKSGRFGVLKPGRLGGDAGDLGLDVLTTLMLMPPQLQVGRGCLPVGIYTHCLSINDPSAYTHTFTSHYHPPHWNVSGPQSYHHD